MLLSKLVYCSSKLVIFILFLFVLSNTGELFRDGVMFIVITFFTGICILFFLGIL